MAVGDLQRLVEADVRALHEDDVLVWKMKNRIGDLFKVAHPSGGLVAAPDALAVKRCRRHAHDERPGFLGQVRQKRSGPRAGAAPHPGDDKDQVGAPDDPGQVLAVGLDGGPSQSGVAAGSQAARDRLAKQESLRLVTAGEAAVVCVQRIRLDALGADHGEGLDQFHAGLTQA